MEHTTNDPATVPAGDDGPGAAPTASDAVQASASVPDPTPAPTPTPAPASVPAVPPAAPDDADVAMTDAPPAQQTVDQAAGQTPALSAAPIALKRSRTASVDRSTNANGNGETAKKLPVEFNPSGDTVRRYLNSHVASILIEGLKSVAQAQPRDPIRFLGEFLIKRADEVEATSQVAS